MSGGSFNYLCFKLDMDDASDIMRVAEDVASMERYLREIGKHEAADEFYRFGLELETHRRRLAIMGKRLAPLARAVEWECSGDVSISAIDNAMSELLKLESPD